MIPSYLIDLTIVLCLYGLTCISCFGWGLVGARLLACNVSSICSPFAIIWLGFAFLLFAVQLAHLFVPLDWRISLAVYGTGLLLALPKIVSGHKKLKEIPIHLKLLYGAILVIVASMTASISMLPLTNYDSGLYHFNSIRWINSYQIVPGLGNLHGRLAFNQSFFAYAASLNFFPYFPNGSRTANSFLLLLVLAQVVWYLIAVTQPNTANENETPLSYFPHMFILPLLVYLAVGQKDGLNSPTPDFASNIIQLCMFLTFVEIVRSMKWATVKTDQLKVLTVLAFTAVTIKLTNLAYSIAVVAVCYGLLLYSSQRKILGCFDLRRLGLFCGAIMAVWITRGYILSGYPLYPLAYGGFGFDWTIPQDHVKDMANWIYSWARLPGVHWSTVLGNWDWIGPKVGSLIKNTTVVLYPTMVGVASLTCLVIINMYGRYKKQHVISLADLVLVIPPVIGLFYWFLTAPDPRFAHSLFWLFSISSLIALLFSVHRIMDARIFKGLVCCVLILVNIPFALSIFQTRPRISWITSRGFSDVPVVTMVQKETKYGLIINNPIHGDQCWDSPLPSSPSFDSSLRLRIPGRIDSGFVVSQ